MKQFLRKIDVEVLPIGINLTFVIDAGALEPVQHTVVIEEKDIANFFNMWAQGFQLLNNSKANPHIIMETFSLKYKTTGE